MTNRSIKIIYIFVGTPIIVATMTAQKTILHIDDDKEDRMMLEEAIKELDAQIIVHQVEDAETALSFLKQSKQRSNLPDLIILDMNLPGMRGADLLGELKKDKELASLPLVIFTTASIMVYKDLLAKETIDLFTKPSSPSELAEIVKKMLSHCPSPEEPK